jgi:GNAT superfamily N-acetyltransferase
MNTGFYISTDKSKLDVAMICDFLANNAYWAAGRKRATIEKSIANAFCFGVYDRKDTQVGFARVITDFSVFAWLLDVFIIAPQRGQGLGKLLIEEIVGHKDLQGVKRWGLGTRDAQGLYQKFGFKPLARPERWMERVNG